MNADEIIAAIKDAVGNPHGGAVAEAMPLIEQAVRDTCGESKGGTSGAKRATETRIVQPEETRDA